MENIIGIVAGIVIAAIIATVVAVLVSRRGQPAAGPSAADTALVASLQQRSDQESARAAALETRLREASQLAALAGERATRIAVLEQQARELADALREAHGAVATHERRAGEIAARAAEKEQSLQAQILKLEAAEQRLAKEFENVANRIFTQKQQQFGEQSKQNLDALLAPFREQIEGFRKKVEEVYDVEQRERHVLKHEITLLKDLNQRITTEAANLTRALKGDNKMQGSWGEMILEKILETSGLREGFEFEREAVRDHDEGKRHRPDVIVHLPEEKDVIIDSKVSLIDWERCSSASDDNLRDAALDAHVASLRNHVKLLGEKNYQQLQGVRSLDYVLMFIPIEAAFHAAIARDEKLVEYALERNIMLVSPTTLLVALRTVHNLWRYEYQNQHALNISAAAGKMYDKLAAFVGDMNDIKTALDRADKAWTSAQNKLVDGKGNVIRQAEKVVALGVKASKKIDKEWTARALPGTDEGDEEPS